MAAFLGAGVLNLIGRRTVRGGLELAAIVLQFDLAGQRSPLISHTLVGLL
jgi:hypothetical protein